MLLTRAPPPCLRPFVRSMWASAPGPERADPRRTPQRQHVLPTGDMHLVFRLSAEPLRLFADAADTAGWAVGHAIVGGARSAFYARELSLPSASVGVQLHPGAAWALFGMPASALAERHTPLDVLWGTKAAEALERLHGLPTLEERLAALAALLAERLARRPQALHPAVAMALRGVAGGTPVRELVRASGYSHRHFVALFKEAAGLPPKRLQRVLRLQQLLAAAPRSGPLPWTDLALSMGYSDQSHFIREFGDIAGMTPEAYRRASPSAPNHVAVEGGRSNSSNTAASDRLRIAPTPASSRTPA
ncbi:helix-turn-helix transcriptional regulator [Variovorax saccharolyticus]|uniref:helix-turn-helix transcriptional regulator n=1 Tax=Variovorax saccharolyticus TaxID=3053516 RepID=UPI002576A37B|nr:helix-turn-helix transcriptional regulator [Variovorax sp. J22R187]MDM0020362.1 helix-turn-helix transcriptional regulator [Variovorax sp. J22R187]